MTDATQNLTPHEKIERLLKSARAILLSEREKISTRATEFQTGTLKTADNVREYESILEELNRYQYTAEMLDMLIKYF
jgi:hypothetical protein